MNNTKFINILRNFKFSYLIFFFLFSYFLSLSVYLSYQGYIRDDWGMFLTYGTNANIIEKFKDIATSLLANRPGLAALNVFFVNIINDNPIIFFTLNFIFFCSAVIIYKNNFQKIILINSNFFIPILLFPVISSTVIFSPLNLLGANFSFLLFAIGTKFFLINFDKKSIIFFSIATFFLSLSLLTYEISGPLILYNLVLIHIFNYKNFNNLNISKKVNVIIPVIASLIIYFIYQKFICGFLDGNECAVTRFKISSILLKPEMIIKTIISYLILIFINLPIFLVSSLNYAILQFDLISWFQIIIALYFLIKFKINFPKNSMHYNFRKFIIFSLIISSLIFVLSGTEYPTFYGYENRGAYPCWIILATTISLFFQKYKNLQKFYNLFLLILIINYTSQAQEIRENYKLQSKILFSVNKFDQKSFDKKFLIILPTFNINYNFSNHEVFRYDWDFPRAINLRNNNKEAQNRFYILNEKNIDDIKIYKDKFILDGYLDISYEKLNLIKYNKKNNEIIFIKKINNYKDLIYIQKNLYFDYNEIINNSVEIEPNNLRRKFKNFILSYF